MLHKWHTSCARAPGSKEILALQAWYIQSFCSVAFRGFTAMYEFTVTMPLGKLQRGTTLRRLPR